MEQDASPASAQKTDTQAGSAGDHTSAAVAAVAALREDLAHSAASIMADRFRQDGIDAAGTAYRALKASSRRPDEAEGWSQLLGLVTDLWDNGHLDAAVKLLKDANIRLSPPETFAATITDSIAFGEDALTTLQVRRKFEAGDEDGARGLVQNIRTELRDTVFREIDENARYRAKSRRTAFVAAGVMAVVLAGSSVYGWSQVSTFLKDRPTFAFPEIDMDQAMPDMSNAQLNLDVFSDATQGLLDQIGQTPPVESMEIAPGAEITGLPAGPVAPSADDSRMVTEDMRQSCALAMRVSIEATRLAQVSASGPDIAAAEGFERDFLAACTPAGLSIEELSRVELEMTPAQITRVAETVLRGD